MMLSIKTIREAPGVAEEAAVWEAKAAVESAKTAKEAVKTAKEAVKTAKEVAVRAEMAARAEEEPVETSELFLIFFLTFGFSVVCL